jgi:hypothetical protein
MPETDQLSRALDHEFPPLADDTRDWDDVLRRATPHPPKRRLLAVRIAGAVALVALIALVATSPWKGTERVGVLDRALAAVGDKPVLHVVLETEPQGDPLVYLDTGQPVTTKETTEIWFDESRGLQKTVSRRNGLPMDEMLETPDGGFTQTGPIYTCKWIAEHPAEAAKARVSCPGGVDPNQSTAPTLDPTLAGFVDHYRAALASGAARRIPGSQVGGRDVIWIEFGAGRARERVALNSKSYTPVLISGTHWSAHVREIETVPYEARLFSRPKPVSRFQGSGEVSEHELDDASAAPAILGGRAFWLGTKWRGLELTSVQRNVWMARYGESSQRERVRGLNVRLTYSKPGEARSSLALYEAASCAMAFGWMCRPGDPEEGMALLRGPMTLLKRDGVFITIFALDELNRLDLARSLRAVPSGGSAGGG